MRILIICGLTALQVAAQENSWKTEIDHSLVRVERRLMAAHETVSAAEMPPALLVFLTDYSVRLTTASPPEEVRGKPGQFLWHPGGLIGLENLTGHGVQVAQIVPKFGPAVPPLTESEPSSALNRHRVEFENELIRVAHPDVRVGRRIAERRDPTVVIHLSTAHIRFTRADGRVEEFQAKAGDILFDLAGAFIFENLGQRHEVLRVELKAGAGVRG
jgi:hypothetical protein